MRPAYLRRKDARNALMCRLALNGYTNGALAWEFDMSESRVRQILRRDARVKEQRTLHAIQSSSRTLPRLYALACQGYDLDDLALGCGWTGAELVALWREEGYALQSSYIDTRCVERYQRGETLRDIARDSGMAWQTVREVLLARGIAMRPRGARPRLHDEEEVRRLYKEYLTRYSIEAVATKHGWTAETLGKAFRRYALPLVKRPPKPRPEKRERPEKQDKLSVAKIVPTIRLSCLRNYRSVTIRVEVSGEDIALYLTTTRRDGSTEQGSAHLPARDGWSAKLRAILDERVAMLGAKTCRGRTKIASFLRSVNACVPRDAMDATLMDEEARA